jgi:hypothetical protein
MRGESTSLGPDAARDRLARLAEDARDIAEAVVPFGMVAHAPPRLLPCTPDTPRAEESADFVERHAVQATDLADDGEQLAGVELREHTQGEARLGGDHG